MDAVKVRCRNLLTACLFSLSVCLLFGHLSAQMPSMMTREQAADILQKILQVGRYPGTLHWATVADLPAQQEVSLYDASLQRTLLEQGENPVPTMQDGTATWWQVASPLLDTYIFVVDHNYLSDTDEVPGVYVNAWTGRVEIDVPKGLVGRTNTSRGLGNLPPLTIDQRRARALEIVQALYGSGQYLVHHELHEEQFGIPTGEVGSQFLIYKIDPQTGARLGARALLLINSRTGWLEFGWFINRPVSISTKPTYTETQARQIALNYLQRRNIPFRDWLQGYQGWKRIGDIIFAGYVDEGLFVEEDGLLEQHLMWFFPYTYTNEEGNLSASCIGVNAHTGDVMPEFVMSLETFQEKFQTKHRRSLQERQITLISVNGKTAYIWEALLLVNGRLFISGRYIDNFGGRWDGQQVIGNKGAVTVTPEECLRRGEHVYLPLRKVCQALGIRLWWDNERKKPILRAEWLEAERLLAQLADKAMYK